MAKMKTEGTIAEVLSGAAAWSVTCADNREVLPGLPDRSVAHVITDPPYEAESHQKGRRIMNPRTQEVRNAAITTFVQLDEETRQAVGVECARLAKRWALIFCQLEGAMLWRDCLGPEHRYIRTMVWVKPNGQPQLTGDRPGVGYECIVVSHPPSKPRWNGGGSRGWLEHAVDANFSREPRVHETQKPIDLMLELVELFTDENEVILDPFCGSGTTGVACLRLGRRFIGIERDEKYAAVARDRLQAEANGLSLRDVRNGQRGLFEVAP